jgi:hypothetical protein
LKVAKKWKNGLKTGAQAVSSGLQQAAGINTTVQDPTGTATDAANEALCEQASGTTIDCPTGVMTQLEKNGADNSTSANQQKANAVTGYVGPLIDQNVGNNSPISNAVPAAADQGSASSSQPPSDDTNPP